MYAIIIITIITVPYNFNAFYNTLKIAILDTLKNNTLKTKILNSITVMTYKSRDALFVKKIRLLVY